MWCHLHRQKIKSLQYIYWFASSRVVQMMDDRPDQWKCFCWISNKCENPVLIYSGLGLSPKIVAHPSPDTCGEAAKLLQENLQCMLHFWTHMKESHCKKNTFWFWKKNDSNHEARFIYVCIPYTASPRRWRFWGPKQSENWQWTHRKVIGWGCIQRSALLEHQ